MAEVGSKVSRIHYGWVIVAAFFIMWAVVFGIQFSFGIFFKSLQDALGCSRATISWAMTINMSVCALTMVPAGWAIDRFNIRIVYSLATFVYCLPLILCSRILEPWHLYLLYGLMGVSAGIFGPSIFTVITRWFTEKRGLALGLASAGTGCGTLVAPLLTNELVASYGWRNTFVVLGLASAIILFICTQFIKNPPESVSDKSRSMTGKSADRDQIRLSTPLQGMTFGQAIETREIIFIIVASSTALITTKMALIHIAPHATDIGISPFMAAMALSTIGCGSLLGRIVMGVLQDRIGPQRSMIICLTTMGVCLFALPFITSDVAFFVFAILFGFALGGDLPQVPAITVQCFGVASMGVIYGLIATVANLISSLAPFVTGYVFDVTHSYTTAFLGTGVLLFLGAFSISRIK
jgi:MFS family permease